MGPSTSVSHRVSLLRQRVSHHPLPLAKHGARKWVPVWDHDMRLANAKALTHGCPSTFQ